VRHARDVLIFGDNRLDCELMVIPQMNFFPNT
jgi:hypothetical protein